VHPITVNGQAQVPAEEAGKLKSISVREGAQVRSGELLAVIDDTQAQKQKRAAAAEHQAAKVKAESDIDVQHADKAAKVAEFDLRRSIEANDKTPGSVSEVEIEQKKFQWHRALLAIKQAQNEQVISGFTAEGKLAEMEAADDAIQRRKITSPIDGVVQVVYPSIGEWVKPGDPVFRIIRMDRLRVEAILRDQHKDLSSAKLNDCPVVVEIASSEGQKTSFNGRIVFVDPEVDRSGQRVYAEVENRQDSSGHWLLRPGAGLEPTMTIQLR
jgi:multidrug efflux pump subunit AcrA (membrane-fusion protein)